MLPSNFKPCLAASEEPDLDKVKFPKLISRKLDGIRCILHPEKGPITRKIKPIKNLFIRDILGRYCTGLDGEILTFDENWVMKDFNAIQSDVMSEDGKPRFRFYAFDNAAKHDLPFDQRLATVAAECDRINNEAGFVVVKALGHDLIHDKETALSKFRHYVDVDKLEGAILRKPDGKYKFGRSTLREEISLKLKDFTINEGRILKIIERMHNANAQETDELGYAKRSSHKANKVPMGTAGTYEVSWQGKVFNLTIGGDDAHKQDVWDNQDNYIGKYVRFRHQGVGTNGKPRIASFQGYRHEDDMVDH